MKHRVWAGALALALMAGHAQADPAKLGSTPAPVVTVKGRSVQDVQNAIVRLLRSSTDMGDTIHPAALCGGSPGCQRAKAFDVGQARQRSVVLRPVVAAE